MKPSNSCPTVSVHGNRFISITVQRHKNERMKKDIKHSNCVNKCTFSVAFVLAYTLTTNTTNRWHERNLSLKHRSMEKHKNERMKKDMRHSNCVSNASSV